MAGAEFNINPFGRVAGGQEGSGQAQILEPYDTTKYDRWAKEQGVKQREAKLKSNKPMDVPDFGKVELGIPTATIKKITDDAQGNKVEQYIQLSNQTEQLQKEGTELWKKGKMLDPNSPNYQTEKEQFIRDYADWDSRRLQHSNIAATTVENAKLQDRDFALINGDRKIDVDPKTAEIQDMLNKMPADEALTYRRSNPAVYWKSSYDFPSHQAKILRNVETMFIDEYGAPSALTKDETSGRWYYTTTKGKKVDFNTFKKGYKPSYQMTVEGDEDLYNLLLTYVPDPNKLNKAGNPMTLSDMAIDANIPVANRGRFAGYIWDNVPEVANSYLPMGGSVTTKSVLGEGGGDTYVNVDANVAPSSIVADKASDFSNINAGLTLFGGGSYAISGATVIPKEDIEKLGGSTSFQATEADIGGTLKININIPVAAGSNLIVYQAATIKDEMPNNVAGGLGVSKNRQISDKQVDLILKNGGAKYLKFLPYAQITGTYDGKAVTGRNTLNNVGSIVSKEAKDSYQRAATEMSKDFWTTLGDNITKYPAMKNGGWRYAATLYQTYYNQGYTADEIFKTLQDFVNQGYQLEQAYDAVNQYLNQ